MHRPAAALIAAAFFVAAPGTMAGLIPWLINGWQFAGSGRAAQAIGLALIVIGIVPPIDAFIRFVRAGGTPMPAVPTQALVVTGFNRHLRNPMYAGLTLVIVGQAILFRSAGTAVWAAVFWATTATFVRTYEEPTLREQFGAEYEAYRRAVPAWFPRLRPWSPQPGNGTPDSSPQ